MTSESATAIHDLLAKEAIRDVLLRYFRGADRQEAALIASAFHEDVEVDHGPLNIEGEPLRGSSTVLQRIMDRATEPGETSLHAIQNHFIVVHGDRASSEASVIRWKSTPSGGAASHELAVRCGRYLDYLERREGEWRIARRSVLYEWSGVASLAREEAGHVYDTGAGSRSREDPSYAFFEAIAAGQVPRYTIRNADMVLPFSASHGSGKSQEINSHKKGAS